MRRRWSLLSLMLIMTWGCGSGYWIEDPHESMCQDPYFDFADGARFTIVRYHSIDTSIDVPRRTEDAFDYDLASNFIARGYEYTTSIDSADFVLAPIVTEAFFTSNRIFDKTDGIPPLPRKIASVSLAALDFGTAEEYPVATPSIGAMRTNPFFELVVYDPRSSRAVYTYAARAVARDTDYRIPSAMMISKFTSDLPQGPPNGRPETA